MPRAYDVTKEAHPIREGMSLAEAEKRLDKLIRAKPDTSRLVTFSPQLAEKVLSERNVSNRPMKAGKIREYANALRAGNWGLTGDTIKFAPDGTLKDGQNRLQACVKAQVPLTTHVVFNVKAELFTVMDIGKNRTPADVLSIAGASYANHTAGTLRWLLIMADDPKNRSAHFNNDEYLHAWRSKAIDRMALEDSIRIAMEVKKETGAPVAAVAALHYIFRHQDPEKATQFMLDWAHAKGPQNAPTRTLQAKLTELMLATNNRIREDVRNALITQAWNAYREGRKLKIEELSWKPDMDFPPLEGVEHVEQIAAA